MWGSYVDRNWKREKNRRQRPGPEVFRQAFRNCGVQGGAEAREIYSRLSHDVRVHIEVERGIRFNGRGRLEAGQGRWVDWVLNEHGDLKCSISTRPL